MINRLSNNATAMVVIIAGFAYLAYLLWINPEAAAVQVIPVLGATFGLAKLLYQTAAVQEKVETLAPKVDTAIAQSQDNNAALVQAAAAADKAAQELTINTVKTDKVHDLVDGQMTAYKDLMDRFSVIEQQLAAAVGEKQGIAIERQRVADEAAPPEAPAK